MNPPDYRRDRAGYELRKKSTWSLMFYLLSKIYTLIQKTNMNNYPNQWELRIHVYEI